MIFEKVTTKHKLDLLPALLQVWENSIKKTHIFLSQEKIDKLRPLVSFVIKNIATLLVAKEDAGEVIGFLGLEGNKIELLFIHSHYFKKGIEKKLVSIAIEKYDAIFVDVNEKERIFYEHMGFSVISRSTRKYQGNSFPVLHMKWIGAATS